IPIKTTPPFFAIIEAQAVAYLGYLHHRKGGYFKDEKFCIAKIMNLQLAANKEAIVWEIDALH
ncbi:4376_t:CDS:2, partial [Entrophospora sp. SA101]